MKFLFQYYLQKGYLTAALLIACVLGCGFDSASASPAVPPTRPLPKSVKANDGVTFVLERARRSGLDYRPQAWYAFDLRIRNEGAKPILFCTRGVVILRQESGTALLGPDERPGIEASMFAISDWKLLKPKEEFAWTTTSGFSNAPRTSVGVVAELEPIDPTAFRCVAGTAKWARLVLKNAGARRLVKPIRSNARPIDP